MPLHINRRRMLETIAFGPSLAASAVPALAQQSFTPAESQVTPLSTLYDPEYSQQSGRVTWIDPTGKLWVAPVDRTTGLFKPAKPRGAVLVDAQAMNTVDLAIVGNGPEWMSAVGPDRIVYTKFVPGMPHTLDNARLAMATIDAQGVWHTTTLSDLPRLEPGPSTDPDDPAPRISYVDPQGNHYWCEVDNPIATETYVPQVPATQSASLRFVPGQRSAVFIGLKGAVLEVFRYWLDTKAVEQLTFDGRGKVSGGQYMVSAPEFDNDYVLMTLANNYTELRIYRQVDKSNPAWSVIYTINFGNGITLGSPEPFVHNGKTYFFVSVQYPPNIFPSAVFISNIDAANPFLRQVTPDTPLRSRRDPEVFVTADGPQIYYNRLERGVTNPNPLTGNGGIFKADTGLGPAV